MAEGISGRMRLALIADLLIVDDDDDVVHVLDLLSDPMKDERQWTLHLGRQLGIRESEVAGVHDTLLLVVRELDDLIGTWPPPLDDGRRLRGLAHEATKHLTPLEVFATLMVGPSEWRDQQVEACKVGKLGSHLQPVLEKGLAAALSRVVGTWIKWDVRKLKQRRKAVLSEARAKTEVGRVPYSRPEGRERWERVARRYQPPGRT